MPERDIYVDRSSEEVVRRPVPVREDYVERTAPITQVAETEPPAVAVDHVQATSYDPYAPRRDAAYRLVQAIYLVFALVEALIAIRFVLRLLGANPSAGFAQFIYGITNFLVAPFFGLFGNPSYDGSVLELTSLTALVVYALLAWLIAKIAWLAVGETRSATVAQTRNVETRVH